MSDSFRYRVDDSLKSKYDGKKVKDTLLEDKSRFVDQIGENGYFEKLEGFMDRFSHRTVSSLPTIAVRAFEEHIFEEDGDRKMDHFSEPSCGFISSKSTLDEMIYVKPDWDNSLEFDNATVFADKFYERSNSNKSFDRRSEIINENFGDDVVGIYSGLEEDNLVIYTIEAEKGDADRNVMNLEDRYEIGLSYDSNVL